MATLCTQQLCRKRLSKVQHVSTPRIASSQPKRGVDASDVWCCTHTHPRVPCLLTRVVPLETEGPGPPVASSPRSLFSRGFSISRPAREGGVFVKNSSSGAGSHSPGTIHSSQRPLSQRTWGRASLIKRPAVLPAYSLSLCFSVAFCSPLSPGTPGSTGGTPDFRLLWFGNVPKPLSKRLHSLAAHWTWGGGARYGKTNQLIFSIRHLATMTGGPKSSNAGFLSELPPSLNHQALWRVKILSHRMSR